MVGSSCLAREASDPVALVAAACAAFAFAADTLLPGLAGLAAVFQHWLH